MRDIYTFTPRDAADVASWANGGVLPGVVHRTFSSDVCVSTSYIYTHPRPSWVGTEMLIIDTDNTDWEIWDLCQWPKCWSGRCLVECWLWFDSCPTSTFAGTSLPHSHFGGHCPAQVAYLGSYELPLVTRLRAATSTSGAMQRGTRKREKKFLCLPLSSSSHCGA